ncbi:hypothetical protein P9112_010683 [Eukaryota sp. TZLM1-RC]
MSYSSAEAYLSFLQQILHRCTLDVDYPSIIRDPQFKGYSQTAETAPYCRLLEIFAYGSRAQYLCDSSTLPSLTSSQDHFLRTISVARACRHKTHVTYADLTRHIGDLTPSEIEEAIISAVEEGLVLGEIDQPRKMLHVHGCSPGHLKDEELLEVAKVFSEASKRCGETKGELEKASSFIVDVAKRKAEFNHHFKSESEKLGRDKAGSHYQ